MEQILIVINIKEGKPQITTNVTFADGTKFQKVVLPDNITEKDLIFYETLVSGINDYRG